MTAIVLDRLFGGDRPRLLIVEGSSVKPSQLFFLVLPRDETREGRGIVYLRPPTL